MTTTVARFPFRARSGVQNRCDIVRVDDIRYTCIIIQQYVQRASNSTNIIHPIVARGWGIRRVEYDGDDRV